MKLVKLTLVVSLFALVPNALAEKTEAKKHYDKATALFENGNYDEALPYFEMANVLSGAAGPTLLGLAQCERALGLFSPAIVHLRLFVQKYPKHVYSKKAFATIVELQTQLKKLEKRKKTKEVELVTDSNWSAPVFWMQTKGPNQERRTFAVGLSKGN